MQMNWHFSLVQVYRFVELDGAGDGIGSSRCYRFASTSVNVQDVGVN